MRMKTPEHVTDRRRAFAMWFVRGKPLRIHGVKDSTVYGFKSVAHVGKRTIRDNAHGVIDKGLFHFLVEIDRYDNVIRVLKCRVDSFFALLIIVFIVWLRCHKFLPFLHGKKCKKENISELLYHLYFTTDGCKTPVKKSAKMLNISLLKALLAVHRHVF